MAINVDKVYKTVLLIINKEQRGYLTPDEFNKIATQVQLEIFESYFETLNQQMRLPQNESEYGDRYKTVQEKLKNDIDLNSMLLKHPGGSIGYKLIDKNSSLVYLCDNEFEEDQRKNLSNFSKNADLLVWDGMFTQKELVDKKGWGHSSIEQAIDFNTLAKCKKILITHHAPSRSDKELDQIEKDFPDLFTIARDGLEMEV